MMSVSDGGSCSSPILTPMFLDPSNLAGGSQCGPVPAPLEGTSWDTGSARSTLHGATATAPREAEEAGVFTQLPQGCHEAEQRMFSKLFEMIR